MKYFLALFLLILGCSHPVPESKRATLPPTAVEDDIAVWFSPAGGAMQALVSEIRHAQTSIDVQAYLLTSNEIIGALVDASNRGVAVRIVLDKNHMGGIYSAMHMAKTPLPIWRDGRHKDAHDKIMLIDGKTIITGSFNFTDESEDTNVENLLIIRNKPKLFAAYLAHFEAHRAHSDPPQ